MVTLTHKIQIWDVHKIDETIAPPITESNRALVANHRRCQSSVGKTKHPQVWAQHAAMVFLNRRSPN